MNGLFDTLTRMFSGVVFWIIVLPWEQAVRVRLGKHVKKLEAGLHLRIPIIDAVYKQSTRWRIALIPTQTMSTLDGHTAVVGATVGYSVRDVEKLYQTLHDAEGTITQLVATRIADAVMTTRKDDLSAKLVNERVTQDLGDELASIGLADVTARVTDFAFVKTFRLINDARYYQGPMLDTTQRTQ